MRPGSYFDLLLFAIVGAAERQFERVCAACGQTVLPDDTCCPEPCS